MRRGFTLIELLIVVAIIAILAAIAIPNFLNAQVRSKVSRVKADMRSVATALESYYVDNNSYPPDATDQYYYGNTFNGRLGPPDYLSRLTFLTTPVAYMTSIPEDPFAKGPAENAMYSSAYRDSSGNIVHPLAFDYAKYDMDANYAPEDAAWGNIAEYTLGLSREDATRLKWALRSAGPDGISVPLGATSCILYDPTNGTTSFGEIVRTNLGQAGE